MASLIGALRISLSADTAQFSRGMSRAQREAATSTSAIQRTFSRMRASIVSDLKGMAKGLATGLAVSAFVGYAKDALAYASSLGETAQQLGVTTKTLQEYRYAAGQAGIEQEEMDKSLAKLTRTIGEAATGAEKPKRMFRALGIEIRGAGGQIRDTGDIIPEIADALNRIPDPARRASIEVALFGKAGQKLDTLLAGGSAGINKLREAVHSLGIVLSEDQIQKADDAADKVGQLKAVLDAKMAMAVADNADSIAELADSLGELATNISAVVKAYNSMTSKDSSIFRAFIGAAIPGYGFHDLAREGAGLPGHIDTIRAASGQERNSFWAKYLTPPKLRAGRGVLADLDLDDLSGKQDRADARAKITSREVGALLRARFGGTVTSTTGGKHERGSLHYSDQAVDWVPRGGMRAVSKDQIRGYLASLGVDVRNVLGPGDKDHEDHFHVSFNKARLSADDLAEAYEKTREETERLRKEGIRAAYEFASGHRRNEIDILQAQRDVAATIEERHSIDKEILNAEVEQETAASRLAVDMRELTQVEADTLLIQRVRLAELKEQAVDEEYRLNLLEEANRDAENLAEIERERLDGMARLAETQAERRTIELEILAAAFRERKAALERAQLATSDVREKARLQAQIDAIPGLEKSARAGVMRDTMGPMESFLNSLPRTAAEVNEALENIAANGLQSLTDGLTDAIIGARSLGDVFKNVSKQIIADLVRIAIQKSITAGLANALGGEGNTGGGGSGILAKLFSAGTQIASIAQGAPGGGFGGGIKSTGNLKGFARGGAFTIGGNRGIDTNLLSINGWPVARVSHSERVTISPPRNDNGGSITRVIVDTSPLLVGRIVEGDARAMMGGSADAQRTLRRKAGRRFP